MIGTEPLKVLSGQMLMTGVCDSEVMLHNSKFSTLDIAMGIRSPRGPREKPLDLYFLASKLKSTSSVNFIYCSVFGPVHSSTIIAQRASAHSVTVMSAVSPKLFRRFTISVCGVAVSNLIRERQVIKRNSHRLLQQGQYLDIYTCMNSLNVDQTPKGIHCGIHTYTILSIPKDGFSASI